MEDVQLTEDERRVDHLIQGKISVDDFMGMVSQKLIDDVKAAVYALLPLTQKRSDYLYAVDCIGKDPNGAIRFIDVVQEIKKHSRYQISDPMFRAKLESIDGDGHPRYDKTAFAIAKHWITMLNQSEKGLNADVQDVVDFARAHPVAPEVPEELRQPRRSGWIME